MRVTKGCKKFYEEIPSSLFSLYLMVCRVEAHYFTVLAYLGLDISLQLVDMREKLKLETQ